MSGASAPERRRPRVSIITPTLNQGRFLEQTIRSIRTQAYQSIEHIVIDGGSTDGTIQILKEHEGSHDFIWQSAPDRGMYDALNKGLALAKGDILGYLNSDDVYPPWAVEVAVAALEASPELDVVFGDGLTIDTDTGRQRLAFVPPFDARSLASTGSLFQPAVFLRRRVYDRHGGFDPDLQFVGDLEYWLRIAGGARFGRIDEVLAVERVHGLALSSASAGPMAVEEAATRRRFLSVRLPVLRRLAARVRAAFWRRRLQVAFLRASRRRGAAGGPWRWMTELGQVEIDPARVALSLVPRLGASFAWNAIRSNRPWFEAPGTVATVPGADPSNLRVSR